MTHTRITDGSAVAPLPPRLPGPVICLHCSTGSSRQWRSLAASLAATLGRHYRVIAPDLLGYGDNPPWRPGQTADLATEVRRLAPLLLAAAGPVDVVGHSFGAAVAVKLALAHPERVRSLTLYEPVLFGLLRGDRHAAEALHEIDAMSAVVGGALEDGDVETAARRFIDFWSEHGTWQSMPEARRAAVRERIHKVGADFAALMADQTTPSELARLAVPVLCLSGARSPAVARRLVQVLASTLPNATVRCLDRAGHMGPLTHANETNPCIAEFIRFPSCAAQSRIPRTLLSARAA